MSAAPLAGLRVADLSRCVAGQFAGRLYADQGADVVLIEPPDGSPTRRTGPFDATGESLLFRHLVTGKREAGRHPDPVAALLDLGSAEEPWDVVIVSDPQQGSQVRAAWPTASVAEVTDFAATGPYAGWTGGELVHQALSGSMYYNGRADAKPLYGTGHRVDYAAGLLLYTSSLAARLGPPARPASTVRVNRHEAAVSMEQNFSTQWAYSHTLAARGEWNRPKGRVRCQDGWLVFFASDHNLAELFAALGAPDAYGRPPFDSWQGFVRHIAEATGIFTAAATEVTQRRALEIALRDKLVLSPVRQLVDLGRDEQLLARGFWTSDGAGRRTLGPVWRHTPSARSEREQDDRRTAPAPRWATDDGVTGPLAGTRVVDLTSAWSGPMATRLLAALGAEVIKVEGPERMDGWRGHKTHPWHPDSYPDSLPGARPYNRNAWFNTQNQGKLSAALDLKHPDGLATARDLVAQSDVVIANFSPGTLTRLGLGIDAARAVNPSIVVAEMSAYGDDGPLRDHRGLGQTMEAMSGITSLIGYEDEDEPLGSGSAYVDPMGGLAGAAAVVTALHRSRRDGSAERVEVPQRESAMHWIGEQILHAIETGTQLGTVGNRHPSAYPHDAYRARGEDEWIAVGVYTDGQWTALGQALGWSDWLDDDRFGTAAQRAAGAAQIDARLSAATADLDKHELAARLQASGVPAAPVQNGPDLYRDPQLRSRDWFTALPHAEVGRRDHPGVPVELDGRLSRPLQAAPLFAEHTDWVLSEVLQLPADRRRELTGSGAVGDPDAPDHEVLGEDHLQGALS